MKDLKGDVTRFNNEFAKLQEVFQQAVKSLQGEPEYGIAKDVTEALTAKHAEWSTAIGPTVDWLEKEEKDLEKSLAESQSRMAEVSKQLDEALAEAAKPVSSPPPPPPPLVPGEGDASYGSELGAELLALIGITPAEARQPSLGSVWELDSVVWKGAMPVPPPPAEGYAEPDIEATPTAVIAALLQFAGIEARDVVYNLGCGDGRLLISAASKHGARGVGIHAKATAVATARENVRKAGLTRLVTIDAGNPLQVDLSSATVVFLALGARQNSEIKDSLVRQLRAGTRVVTHQGGLPGWQPGEEQVVRDEDGKAYRLRLWQVQGRMRDPGESLGNLSEGDWESRAE
jgi:SAM-dependent methyltransferase